MPCYGSVAIFCFCQSVLLTRWQLDLEQNIWHFFLGIKKVLQLAQGTDSIIPPENSYQAN